MPEIKNTFTQGKMNKDLDERIIPNGQYRDAMNVKVSSSENSDVGTIQNILGNSLVPGQNFISDNAVCIGSISDEKNDRLYYFVTNQNLISNGDFSQDVNNNNFADGWSEQTGWDFDPLNEVMVGNNVALYNRVTTSIPNQSLVSGDIVSASFTIKDYKKGELEVHAYNENGEGFKVRFEPYDGNFTITGVVGDNTASSSSWHGKFFIRRIGNTGFTGKIDDICLTTGNDYIIEYNTKNYRIQPVIVDIKKDTLKFRPNKKITGINIIENMLMWTDNFNEPRKINIQRCKEGFVNNNTHTKLVVNNSVSNFDIKEENITVVKKRPFKAPKIKVNIPAGANILDSNCDFSQGSSSVNQNPNDPYDGGGDGANLVGQGDNAFVRVARTASDFSNSIQATILGNFVDPPAQTVTLANPINYEGGNYLFATNPFGTFNYGGGNTNENLPIIYRFNYDNGTQDDIYYSESLPQSSDPNNDGTGAIRFDNLDPLNVGVNHDNGAGWLRFHFYNNPSSGPYSYQNGVLATDAEQQWEVGEKIKIYFKWYSSDSSTQTLSVALIDYDGQSSDVGFGNHYQVLDTKDFTRDSGDVNQSKAFFHTFTIPSSHTGGIIRAVMYNGGSTIISGANIGPGNNPDDGDYIDRLSWAKTAEVITPEDFYEPTDEITVDSSVNVNAGDLIAASGFGPNLHVLDTTTSGGTTTLKLSQTPDSNFYPNILDSNWPTDQWQPSINIANFETTASYNIGDILLLSQPSEPGTLPSNFQVRGSIVDIFEQIGTPGFTEYKIEVSSIATNVPTTAAGFDTPPNPNVPGIAFKTTQGVSMNTIKEIDQDRLFEEKFVRFATRWKYEDGEYSAFSPFTDVAFNASAFAFHPTKNTYNLGVQNNCQSIDLIDIVPAGIPEDVVQVDILFKQENSATVYSIDTIKPNDPIPVNQSSNDWNTSVSANVEIYGSYSSTYNQPTISTINLPTSYTGKYTVLKENIHAALASNQLLRPWDNVPRFALAQEITSNRLVYANYTQGYNMYSLRGIAKPELSTSYKQRSIDINSYIDFTNGQKSLKTFRTYQLGVVFGDEYGRETPVFTSKNASVKIPWDADSSPVFNGNASRSLQLTTVLENQNNIPTWATYYKIFIKQNSGEYYNLTMDRVYRAEDPENLWISFPSSDINKLQKEDYLILKKQAEQELQVPIDNKFKVIDIKNEAPEYIKFKYYQLGNVGGIQNIVESLLVDFIDFDNLPQENESQILIDKTVWVDNDGAALEDLEERMIFQFSIQSGTNRIESSRYEILSLEVIDEDTDPKYRLRLDRQIDSEDGFAANPTTTTVDNSLRIKISKKTPRDSSEFEGRFFVKIISDNISTAFLEPLIIEDISYRLIANMETYYFADEQADYDSGEGNEDGVGNVNINYTENTKTLHGQNKSDTQGAWNNLLDFGQNELAPNFFIDRTYMASGQPVDPSDPTGQTGSLSAAISGQLWRGDFAVGGVIDSLEGIINISGINDYIMPNTGGYGGAVGSRLWRNSNDTSSVSWDNTYEPADPNNATGYFMHLSISPVGNNLHDNNWNNATNSQGGITWQGISAVNGNTATPPFTGVDPGDGVTPTINYGSGTTQTHYDNYLSQWKIMDEEKRLISEKIQVGAKFRFTGSEEIFTIKKFTVKRLYNHTNLYENVKIFDGNNQIVPADNVASPSVEYFYNIAANTQYANGSALQAQNWAGGPTAERTALNNAIYKFGHKNNRRLVYIIELDKDPNDPLYNINPYGTRGVDTFASIRFFDEVISDGVTKSPTTPAIWETKQKSEVDLNIYYEASNAIPVTLKKTNKSNAELFAPIGSRVLCNKTGSMPQFPSNAEGLSLIITNWHANDGGYYNVVEVASPGLNVDTSVAFTNDAAGLAAQTDKYEGKLLNFFNNDNSFVTAVIYQVEEITDNYITKLSLITKVTGGSRPVGLSYYDCFSFGNGVESNRIRDDFNEMTIGKGVKASSVLEEQYKTENRKSGLIYSGIYNSTSGVNSLNQFIAAEKITKDLNPTYGSIQKLFQRRVNLVALCEDRIVKITAGKDTLYNADGNTQLLSTNRVLGDINPFIGDYGISKNPESFAKESYRAYFTDKQRGAVLRLSMDGLTPISSAGMNDYFRDNLKNTNSIIGSYDSRNKNYNVTLSSLGNKLSRGIGSPSANLVSGVTISFDESVKGWTSFKSFIPEHAVSSSNNYYTFNEGRIWKHDLQLDFNGDDVNRNTFYNNLEPSTITSVLNTDPGVIKSYNTLNYEGTENWIGESVITDQQSGTVGEFIEKEGKWFNYIRGEANVIDLQAFNFQGIGETIGIEYNI